MADKIKIILPLIIILALALIGIIGYTADESGSPVRVLFETKGGNIIFSHRTHVEDYGVECVKCHHPIEEGKPVLVWDCRACHRAGTDYDSICADRPVHKQCIGANCIDCHREMGLDEKECGLCHRSR